MSDELNPCPFCGGTDLYWPHGTDPAIIECGGEDGCGACSGVPDEQSRTGAITAWNRRANLAQAPAPVRVKGLQWIEIEDDDCDFEAFSSGLRYWIVSVTDHQHTVKCNTYEIGDCLTVGKAKAAAQADYEARILAALESPDAGVVAELVEAAKPFAEYMNGGMDRNSKGEPLPDDERVGWIYMNHGQFRRLRAALALIAHNTTEG